MESTRVMSTGPTGSARPSAVVFAYHDVGVRCLLTLLARGVDVKRVVTHRDNPAENIWFGSVRDEATSRGIDVRFAEDLDATELHDLVASAQPDFLFSFYFRSMLPTALLALASRGAYNLHGSLLPRYRGRVPINWAIIHGETETGATLHEMTAKPDAGAIIGQTVVPILPDDTAHEVFVKVTVAAEQTLWHALPDLIDGVPDRMKNDLSRGSYFGGRRAEDGRIDWTRDAKAVHDLVRAVAPPYPGATTSIEGVPVTIERTRIADRGYDLPATRSGPMLVCDASGCHARCGDGRWLEIVAVSLDGAHLDGRGLGERLGHRTMPLADRA